MQFWLDECPNVDAVVCGDGERAIAEIADGAHAIYNCANPPYHRWAADWPPLAASVLDEKIDYVPLSRAAAACERLFAGVEVMHADPLGIAETRRQPGLEIR